MIYNFQGKLYLRKNIRFSPFNCKYFNIIIPSSNKDIINVAHIICY